MTANTTDVRPIPETTYGDLRDYATGRYVRPATEAERDECRAEVARGHHEGVILVEVDGEERSCWVDE